MGSLSFVTALALSAFMCFLLGRSRGLLAKFARRHDLAAVQASHVRPTLRLAGVAIVAAIWMTDLMFGGSSALLPVLLISVLPVFLFGVLEDIGVGQSPRRRLAASIVSGSIFIALTGTYLFDPGIFFPEGGL